ncbi:hypothetical protein [uncultured Bacteroides sp.]|nr:hypothetical protein [uncultured Bacteroides sp.]
MQDVKISLERINEIHCSQDEQKLVGKLTDFARVDKSVLFLFWLFAGIK